MNKGWTESIKKCINVFGVDLTSAIIFAAQNKMNKILINLQKIV